MVYLKRLVCAWVGVSLVVVLGGLSRAQATVPGQNGKIALMRTSSVEGKPFESYHTILVGTVEGDGVLGQVGSGTMEQNPSWSPDGKKVVFEKRIPPLNQVDLFIANEDGSGEARFVSSAGDDLDPDWSPDGSRIAFSTNKQLAVVNSDGSGLRVLGGVNGSSPSWSPDGKRIVFSSENLLFIIDVGSGVTQQVGGVRGSFPSWSPDGSKILFITPAATLMGANIYTVNPDGNEVRALTNYESYVDKNGDDAFIGPCNAERPVWSPDGKQVLFLHCERTRYGLSFLSQVWLMDSNGGNQHKVDSGSLGSLPVGIAGVDYHDLAWQTLNATPVRGDCNGVNCSDSPRLVVANEKKLTKVLKKPVAFSKAKLGVSGTLLNQSGQPIGNAVVDVLQKASLPGAEQVKVGEVKTDAKGVWKTTVAAGPSRSLQFAYRAYQNDKNYSVLSSVFSQRVRGSVSLKLPKRAKRGKKLVLEGSLAGGFVPAQGKVVELQVLYKKKYRVFKTIRTDAKGVFRLQFRFGNSYRPGTYRLRVNVRSEPAWPFLATTSKTRKIQVR